MKTKILFTVVIFIAASAILNGQSAGQGKGLNAKQGSRISCVDQNNNGTCDNYESRSGSGISRGRSSMGNGMMAGRGNGNCNGTGQKSGKGKGQGTSKGVGFIDSDNDGVCDNYSERKK